MQQRRGVPLTPLRVVATGMLIDPEAGKRQCTRCLEVKPFSEFNKHHSGPNGYHSYCRECAKPSARKGTLNRYGLTEEKFVALLEKQGGGCAICGTDKPGGKGTWHVDHDHNCCPGRKVCGKCVRGLLCSHCNTGLGKFQEDQEIVMKAYRYLVKACK